MFYPVMDSARIMAVVMRAISLYGVPEKTYQNDVSEEKFYKLLKQLHLYSDSTKTDWDFAYREAAINADLILGDDWAFRSWLNGLSEAIISPTERLSMFQLVVWGVMHTCNDGIPSQACAVLLPIQKVLGFDDRTSDFLIASYLYR